MLKLTFTQIFAVLLLLAALSGFAVSPRLGDRARAPLQGLFAPVAIPARALGGFLRGRLAPEPLIDLGAADPAHPRSAGQLIEENQALRLSVASLTQQLTGLRQLNQDREVLTEVRQLCIPVKVIGADSGLRDALLLGGSSLDGISAGAAALYRGGIAGRVDRAAIGGLHVRLITDRGFRVTGMFGRFEPDSGSFTPLVKLSPLIEGVGDGLMVVRHLSMREADEVRIGDWVVLRDESDWPAVLQGFKLGQVVKISPSSEAPLFARIEIRPSGDLTALREVMVIKG